MTHLLLLLADITERLFGLPDIDANVPVTRRLRIRSTVAPPERLDYIAWTMALGVSRKWTGKPDAYFRSR